MEKEITCYLESHIQRIWTFLEENREDVSFEQMGFRSEVKEQSMYSGYLRGSSDGEQKVERKHTRRNVTVRNLEKQFCVCLFANKEVQVSEYHRMNSSWRDFNLFISANAGRAVYVLVVDIEPLDSVYSFYS